MSADGSSSSGIDDGRPVQLGGEVVGPFHTAYLGLVEELGLTLAAELHRRRRADRPTTSPRASCAATTGPSRPRRERDDYERVEKLYGALVATVDPADPWSHPDASLLDGASLADWLRSVDASPAVIRCLATAALALADGSIEYTSLLSELRKSAAAARRVLRLRALGVAAGHRGQRRGRRAAGARARRRVRLEAPSSTP